MILLQTQSESKSASDAQYLIFALVDTNCVHKYHISKNTTSPTNSLTTQIWTPTKYDRSLGKYLVISPLSYVTLYAH